MENALQMLACVIACFLFVGCQQSLPDDRILEIANGYAVSRGLNLMDYEVSLSEIDSQSKEFLSRTIPQSSRFSKTRKAIGDCRMVVFTPKKKSLELIYTFYVDKKTGELAGVSRRKRG